MGFDDLASEVQTQPRALGLAIAGALVKAFEQVGKFLRANARPRIEYLQT